MEPLGTPFLLMAGASQKINRTRILESVVTAVIIGSIVWWGGKYVALPVIEDRLDRVIVQVKEIQTEMNERGMRRDARDALRDAKIVQLQIELARRQARN